MHIPDGYLSPRTCAVFFTAMAPLWYIASRKVEKNLKLKQLPLLALGAAFTFVIMMFNIPIPGGSTGHMVGGVIVAIVLGPWAGVVSLSLALTLQAFLFGDGGVTALGANCFNMAFLMSFSGYYIYKAVTIGDCGAARRWIGSAIAAYAAVNIAALAVALELGIQPLIAHGVDGRPLYAPYSLSISIPAMVVPHLIFFGTIEALGTALVVSYIHKYNQELLHKESGNFKPLWAILIILIILTPIGLIATGTPWGEWGKEEILNLVGYMPEGMDRVGESWKGILPDYALPGIEGKAGSSIIYVISALIGSIGVVAIIYLWGKLWRK
ncbi:MAG: cobalt transporter CbiM [Deltaproteobacteria bacterium]|nr:cobalt transporter CbiM [Deltaproteobacteria bacterium]